MYKLVRTFTGLLFVFIAGSKFGLFPSAVNSPEMFTPEGWAFISVIASNGYLFPTIGVLSLVAGLMFLSNRYVALGALLLLPITANFALFHFFLGFPIDSAFTFGREIISYIPLALVLYILYNERHRLGEILKP